MNEHLPQVIINRAAELRETSYQRFLRQYEKSNPRPSYEWFVGLNVISTISLMLVVASSTAIAFTNAAFNELSRYLETVINPQVLGGLALLVGVFSVLGIEGTIVTVAMKEGLVKNEQELEERKLIASYLLLAISVIAGFYQRIGLVGNESAHTVAGWVLAFVGAIGAPFALMYAAPFLGQLKEFQYLKEKQWKAEAEAQFRASNEYELSQREMQDTLAEAERRLQAAEELNKAEQAKLLGAINRGRVIVSGPDQSLNIVPAGAAAMHPPAPSGNGHTETTATATGARPPARLSTTTCCCTTRRFRPSCPPPRSRAGTPTRLACPTTPAWGMPCASNSPACVKKRA